MILPPQFVYDLLVALIVIGTVILVLGLVKLVYVPLAGWFEVRDRWRRRRQRRGGPAPTALAGPSTFVSVVVPGYNESAVIANCVHSVVASAHTNLEVILVDDGSSDDTYAIMQSLADQYDVVRAITQPNSGKGAALNRGAQEASGEILLFVDSDGVFLPDTITELLRGFDDPRVGAVCGDDRPVNTDRLQTRLLTVISHVGTGLVRRALHILRCLPIVSGNIGAFRRDALQESGLLREDTLGEDLELTWRLRSFGYRAAFAPRALVYAESPSSLRGLWKQRVRWARGLLQTVRIHARMIANPRYGTFGAYLLYTVLSMILFPILQLAVLLIATVLLTADVTLLPVSVWQLLLWLGLPLAIGLVIYAMVLNRALQDLRFAWTLPLWPAYSVLMSFTMLRALWLEATNAPARWNKLERTGVVSVGAARSGLEETALTRGATVPSPEDDVPTEVIELPPDGAAGSGGRLPWGPFGGLTGNRAMARPFPLPSQRSAATCLLPDSVALQLRPHEHRAPQLGRPLPTPSADVRSGRSRRVDARPTPAQPSPDDPWRRPTPVEPSPDDPWRPTPTFPDRPTAMADLFPGPAHEE